MKAIMISIKPRWCALIMNGDKIVEVRKGTALYKATQKLIDKYGYAEIYVYCSKDEYLYRTNKGYIASKKPLTVGKGTEYTFAYSDEGKVLFKFRCYKEEEVKFIMDYIYGGYYNTNSYANEKCFERDCCLTIKELDNYINKNNLNKRDNVAYALHISNLEIFDKPKELCEFSNCDKYPYTKYIGKAPQNFCYIESEE